MLQSVRRHRSKNTLQEWMGSVAKIVLGCNVTNRNKSHFGVYRTIWDWVVKYERG